MSVRDLYAVSAKDLEAGNILLSDILSLEFVGHNSHFFGDYDLAELPNGTGSIKLQPNQDPEFAEGVDPPEERFMEHQFPDHALLLYVDVEELTQAERIKKVLLAPSLMIKFLKREEIKL